MISLVADNNIPEKLKCKRQLFKTQFILYLRFFL